MDLVYKVRFADSVLMSADEGVDIGWGKDLISYTLDFVNSLREINMDLTEFCILNAIILTYPGKDLLSVIEVLPAIKISEESLRFSVLHYSITPVLRKLQ